MYIGLFQQATEVVPSCALRRASLLHQKYKKILLKQVKIESIPWYGFLKLDKKQAKKIAPTKKSLDFCMINMNSMENG
jgi:hypothetical protein